jgi:peptide deformylase
MIKELIKYPQTLSKEFNAPVRFFDENLQILIRDLKDTIVEHNLEALTAYQINNPYNVLVVKQNDDFLVLINPRIYQEKGTIQTEETTTYFGNISATMKRYKDIKLTYEDEQANTKYLDASDDFAVLLQRKIDYMYGGTIRYRLEGKDQDNFDRKLQYGNDALQNGVCPTNSIKDKISIFTNYLIIFSFVSLLLIFILDEQKIILLQQAQTYSMLSILALILIYIPYGYYEGKINKGCTSCQLGNILGTALISTIKLSVLFTINYFIF